MELNIAANVPPHWWIQTDGYQEMVVHNGATKSRVARVSPGHVEFSFGLHLRSDEVLWLHACSESLRFRSAADLQRWAPPPKCHVCSGSGECMQCPHGECREHGGRCRRCGGVPK